MNPDDLRFEIKVNITEDYSPITGSGRSLATYDVEAAEEFEIEIGELSSDDWFDWQWFEEPDAIRDLSDPMTNWAEELSNITVIGTDGGSCRIKRDRVHYIETRAGFGIYDTTPGPLTDDKIVELTKGSAFFLIDSALADANTSTVRHLKRGDLRNDDASWVSWNPSSDTDPGGQSVGLEARLRSLTEVTAWDQVRKDYSNNDIDLIIFDGSIYPSSTKAEEEDDVLNKTLKPLYESGLLFCGLVKQTDVNAFVQKISDEIDDVDPRRFASDISFLRNYLNPHEATPFFLLNITGPKQVSNDEKPWMPANCYFMTSTGQVFRLEMPSKFVNDGVHVEILRTVAALTEQNNGEVPVPIQLSDNYFGFTKQEQERIAASIESMFEEEKGISLYQPYRENV